MSLRNNLEFFGNSSPVTLSKEQHCYYLNCWINDNLINMKFNFEYPKYQEISLYIVSYFNEFPNIEKCKYNEFSIKDKEDIQNTKTLYDYGLDFQKIILYSNKYGCTKENETYIKNIREVYNKVRSDCTQTSRKPYCVVWDHIKEVYGDEQISQLACKRIYTDPSEVQLESDQLDMGTGIPESSPERRSFFGGAEGDASPTALSSTTISIILTLLGLTLIFFILYRVKENSLHENEYYVFIIANDYFEICTVIKVLYYIIYFIFFTLIIVYPIKILDASLFSEETHN